MRELLLNVTLDNYAVLMELFGLLILIKISTHVPDWVKKMTRYALLLQLAVSICYHVEQWTHGFAALSPLRPLLTACSFSIYPLIMFFMIRIILEEKLDRARLVRLLLPELIGVPLYFSSQWTHLVCWFTPDNVYKPGPLSMLPYAVIFFYSVVFLVENIRFFRKFNNQDRIAAAYTILAPLIGMIALRAFRTDADYSMLLTAAIVLYYAFIYIHMAKIDSLTGLLNRKCCYEDIQNRAKSITAVVSADMNDLKYFNDTFGHQVGDEALKTVAEILRKHCGRRGTAYRVGGDEFIILYSAAEEIAVHDAIADMQLQLRKTKYTCAFGCAMLQPGESLDEAMVKADQAMYADKAAIKMKQKKERRTSRD